MFGTVPFRNVSFGSSVNGQNQMERNQKRTDMKMKDDSFFALLFHALNTEENWIVVIAIIFQNYFDAFLLTLNMWNGLFPTEAVPNGTVPFSPV